ncbi:HNH endonuclease signature motif containing protein [Aeromicrobium sp. CnD17-E]|uniref:HNH endonuclease signature motif containing protein n=1 Tax=Aeromicrobium sp. CnD17-E TaxID=2954487 RepID=UPI0020970D6B|nr:HNH endonuclease signature motif containing protein [Aeromicrobium sp. CnD17-E]MCO7239061.1 HNH endonuclease [Aeromicrobium sp. CnD17-E]
MNPTDTLLADALDASRRVWAGEAEQARAVLRFVETRRTDALTQGLSARQVEDARQVAILEAALELHLAQGFVANLVSSTRTLVMDLPTVWAAHLRGEVDRAKAREIASTAWKLHAPENITRLDETVLAYATTHTLGQLKGWLRRFLIRVEPDHAIERRKSAHADRNVTITALDDGMSLLQALIPTTEALLIDRDLTLAAKASRHATTDDDRTLAQARADALVDTLLRKDVTATTSGRGRFHVGITVSLATLLGLSSEPGVSADGQHVLDPALLAELAAAEGTLFSRLLTDENGGILDVTELGRFPTQPLRRALNLIDGTCDVPGCTRPATGCDVDHQIPYDPDPPPDARQPGQPPGQQRGPTAAGNLHHRCRPHHGLKTRGALTVTHDQDGNAHWHLPTRTIEAETAFTRAWTRRDRTIQFVEIHHTHPDHIQYRPR